MMNLKTIAGKIGVTIILLVVVVLFTLYLSLEQLFQRVLTTQGESKFMVITFQHIQSLVILAGAGAVLLAAGLTVFLSQRLARPLVQMEAATREISKGNYRFAVPIQGNDEVARLGQAIAELARHLDHLESARKEFLADISHELRTPLSYIRGYSQVLFEHLVQSPSEQEAYLKLIYDESKRIEQLIENLFTLAQTDEGILRMNKEHMDVVELVHTVCRRIRPKASERSIQIEMEVQPVPVVWADSLRFEQVMLNLLDNAVRYNVEGGNIAIRVFADATHVHVSITNTGPGIPSEELPLVWDRLYRVEKSRSRMLGGTGLGLAIVKQIVEQHGGTVQVMSCEGRGTTFSFTLPLPLEPTAREGVTET